ncbi:hypothetical protein NE578_00990 [Schaalia odontolytica]|nr:hypothetical protein [Schaalia odontolytica]MCQ5271611.1 hypothetical protein [Schaalia odontolytica]
MMDNEHNDRKTPVKLEPLIPQYLEEEHEVYVSALEEALLDDRVKNIALSGIYGVGKSSILRQFTENLGDRVIEISLSTLAPVGLKLEESSLPSQAATPTNRIQQEIVKQLLYRERPSKAPASRFRRIAKFSCWYAIGVGVLLGFVATLFFMLADWDQQLAMRFMKGDADVRIIDCAIFVALIALFVLLQRLIHGKVRIKHLSAGAASITLEETSVSYFDQYLDEIVYFFQVEKYDVVVFEDIDRFDDAYIFETLKSLNGIINHVPKIKKPIRFIYAIKDSIFDQECISQQSSNQKNDNKSDVDSAHMEIERANRTKFFDVIIPVVPFISQATAHNIAFEVMGTCESGVDPELLDLAGYYLPDMRLLKNIRNEFVIFRQKIFAEFGKELGLEETRLYAMILYKNSHLLDFEKIRLGTSKLDELYRLSRNLVAYNIRKLEAERRDIAKRLARQDVLCEDALQFGEKLVAYVHNVAEVAQVGYEGYEERFAINGEPADDVRSVNFWLQVASLKSNDEITWERGNSSALRFTRRVLEKELSETFDVDEWRKGASALLTDRIAKIDSDIAFLKGAEFVDLCTHPEFLVYEHETEVFINFSSAVRNVLGNGLASKLIRSGYLDKNFALYSSTYRSSRVSVRAMNFIIHHVNRNHMDVHYFLDHREIEAIVSQYGRDRMSDPVFYNVAILDWLFEYAPDVANDMVATFDQCGPEQIQFLRAYLEGGLFPDRAIERLAAISVRVLEILVTQLDLSDDLCVKCVDMALCNREGQRQRVSPEISDYLRKHYSSLSVCIEKVEDSVLESVVTLFDDASVKVPMLSSVSFELAAKLIQRNLYEITRDNLSCVVGGDSNSVALDVIKASNEVAYDYVLDNLQDYLRILADVDHSVDGSNAFVSVISDLVGMDLSDIGRVIDKAKDDCEVSDLNSVSPEVWPVLVSHRRCPATWMNVTKYVFELGFEGELLVLLNDTRSISDVEDVDDLERNRFAIHILDYCGLILDVDLAVQLVNSLHLEAPLDASSIDHPTGDMLAGLLEGGSIADCPDSYRVLVSSDWQSRKMYILASEKFVTFMTPQLIGGDLSLILADVDIPRDIHEKILEDIELYSYGVSYSGLSLIAERACEYEMPVPLSVLNDMVDAHVDVRYVLPLLTQLLDHIGCQELRSILNGLGGVYADLKEVGHHVVRIPNVCGSEKLLDRLKDCGTVSSWSDEGSLLKVNRKRV